jgi:hypothetical protein
VADVESVFQRMVDEYYHGCKRYAEAPRDDSGDRLYWRIALGVLERYGDLLAEALGQAEPDWRAMRDIAEQSVGRKLKPDGAG